MARRIRGALAGWSELLLPTRCLGCGGAGGGPDGVPVCPACRTRMPDLPGPGCARCQHPVLRGLEADGCPFCLEWPTGLCVARSATPFQGPAAALVRALKYEAWTGPVPVLARRTAARIRAEPGLWPRGVVTAVPTTPRRLRERGFNPAELLAREVARILGSPYRDRLRRTGEGRRQAGLPASERASNVRGVFAPTGLGPGADSHSDVLLVDDVLTTGATVAEAARILLESGVRSVTVVTFARAFTGLPGSGSGVS